jgi:hypothetical protein
VNVEKGSNAFSVRMFGEQKRKAEGRGKEANRTGFPVTAVGMSPVLGMQNLGYNGSSRGALRFFHNMFDVGLYRRFGNA